MQLKYELAIRELVDSLSRPEMKLKRMFRNYYLDRYCMLHLRKTFYHVAYKYIQLTYHIVAFEHL